MKAIYHDLPPEGSYLQLLLPQGSLIAACPKLPYHATGAAAYAPLPPDTLLLLARGGLFDNLQGYQRSCHVDHCFVHWEELQAQGLQTTAVDLVRRGFMFAVLDLDARQLLCKHSGHSAWVEACCMADDVPVHRPISVESCTKLPEVLVCCQACRPRLHLWRYEEASASEAAVSWGHACLPDKHDTDRISAHNPANACTADVAGQLSHRTCCPAGPAGAQQPVCGHEQRPSRHRCRGCRRAQRFLPTAPAATLSKPYSCPFSRAIHAAGLQAHPMGMGRGRRSA